MKKLVLFILLLLKGYVLYSQVQCGFNAGFETGTFTGWSGSTGICNSAYCDSVNMIPGLVAGRHTITSGSVFDWRACNAISTVCPFGGTYSMQLGNSNVNWETEEIQYSYTVSATNPILVYAYAVALQDPNHPDTAQPGFRTLVRDMNNNVIPCSFYRVNATQLRTGSLCNWSPPVWYKNWTQVAIDLSAYAGQTVTIYFRTNDCGWGAHFGYAYVDIIGCYPKEISLVGCAGSTSVTLTAPPGFQSYLWSTGQNTQSITVNPIFTPSVSCTINSFQGCQIVLNANTLFPMPNVSFRATSICVCDGPNVFTNLTSAVAGDPIIRWEWDFGDGTAHVFAQNTSHQYLRPGIYTVSLIVRTTSGCNYGTTKQVYVYPCPTLSMISHN